MSTQPIPRPHIVPAKASSPPVLLSVPHAGRDYPDWLVGLALHGRPSLFPLEDPRVDELVRRAVARGIGAVIARSPRALIDCNRSPHEIDPTVIEAVVSIESAVSSEPGPRARGGLGIVPGRTAATGRLWSRQLTAAEFATRLAAAHQPYHRAITAGLQRILELHGSALLIDCHSMPPRHGAAAQIVIGDCRGASAAGWVTSAAAAIARRSGFSVGLNDPYAGGWIVEQHGRPADDVHALQVEIDRSCYLAADLKSPGPGFGRTARLIDDLVAGLGRQLAERSAPLAAQ